MDGKLRNPIIVAGAVGLVTFTALIAAAWFLLIRPATTTDIPSVGIHQLLTVGAGDDWRWSQLEGANNVFIVEFSTLAAQGRAFNRLAALIEKRGGPRDRVLSDKELGAFIEAAGADPATFYIGHDYRLADVARFFAIADIQNIPLNNEETRLRAKLTDLGAIAESSEGPVALLSPGALVSYPRAQLDDPNTPINDGVSGPLRSTILRHELSHGVYFTNPAYREHAWAFWKSMTERERSLFREFLDTMNYDGENEDLMVNETQAYMFHTPNTDVFDPMKLGLSADRIEALRKQFIETAPETALPFE